MKRIEMTVVLRQMATLLAAGIPLIQSLELLQQGQIKTPLRRLLSALKNALETGHSFTMALRQQNCFNELICNLVAVGEQTGTLDDILGLIASHQEKLHALSLKVRKALYYPAVVVCVAGFVTTALLMFVVPQFAALYQGVGAELPRFTQLVLNISNGLQRQGLLLIIGLIATTIAMIYAKRQFNSVAYFIDKLLLHLPLIGTILTQAAMARFSRTLAISYNAGLPLIDALRVVAPVTGNRVFTHITLKVREDVATGQQLHIALHKHARIPSLVIQMIASGEFSGTLDRMLQDLANLYELSVDHSLDSLSSLIEPLIMVILGLVIGSLVIAMYLPIFKLGSVF